MQNHFIIKKRD